MCLSRTPRSLILNEMIISFEREFKRRCSEAYQYSPEFAKIMENLEMGKADVVRRCMDDSIDDLQYEINQHIGPDEHSIHNARVDQLNLMYEAWYELMQIIDLTLEKQDDLLRKSVNQ